MIYGQMLLHIQRFCLVCRNRLLKLSDVPHDTDSKYTGKYWSLTHRMVGQTLESAIWSRLHYIWNGWVAKYWDFSVNILANYKSIQQSGCLNFDEIECSKLELEQPFDVPVLFSVHFEPALNDTLKSLCTIKTHNYRFFSSRIQFSVVEFIWAEK